MKIKVRIDMQNLSKEQEAIATLLAPRYHTINEDGLTWIDDILNDKAASYMFLKKYFECPQEDYDFKMQQKLLKLLDTIGSFYTSRNILIKLGANEETDSAAYGYVYIDREYELLIRDIVDKKESEEDKSKYELMEKVADLIFNIDE